MSCHCMVCYDMLYHVMPHAWLHVVPVMTNVAHETLTTVIYCTARNLHPNAASIAPHCVCADMETLYCTCEQQV